MIDKRVLRPRLRAMRDAAPRDRPILAPAPFRERLVPGIVVAAYIPIGSEADPAPLVGAARAAGCRIALPHVTSRAAPLRFLAADDAALVPGPFGLRQPPAEAAMLAPAIILTPLLGFDRHGTRLGQGAGHYDRAFAACPDAWRVGVAWSCQCCDTLPVDAWDMPLHAIVTEQDWITP